jgi:hypothetical protein
LRTQAHTRRSRRRRSWLLVALLVLAIAAGGAWVSKMAASVGVGVMFRETSTCVSSAAVSPPYGSVGARSATRTQTCTYSTTATASLSVPLGGG